jgi:RNA polymerase primary sigma factor
MEALRRTSASSSDSIAAYLREISRVPLLSPEDEVELAKRIEAGLLAEEALGNGADPGDEDDLRTLVALGEEARQRMIQANLRLVVAAAKRYAGHALSLLDLVQEGNLGLMHAVTKFDHALGFRFSTYALWWIKQSLSRAVSDQGRTIRIPTHVSDNIQKVLRRQHEMFQSLGRPATLEELACELDMETEQVCNLLRWAVDTRSLHATTGEEGSTELADLVADEAAHAALDQVHESLLRDDLATALAGLDERERDILTLHFGLHDGRPRSLDELATVLGISRERVRQIEIRALAKLRRTRHAEALVSYLR